jgi:hypothetical protein
MGEESEGLKQIQPAHQVVFIRLAYGDPAGVDDTGVFFKSCDLVELDDIGAVYAGKIELRQPVSMSFIEL